MPNFKTTTLTWILALGGLWLIRAQLGGFAWAALLVSWVYFSILVLGCIFIRWNFWFPTVCAGPKDTKRIAISFDDGPAGVSTDRILHILAGEQVKAAFFCIGKNMAGHEEQVKRIDAEGHIIGNHSDSHHMWFDVFSTTKMISDLRRMDQRCLDIVGKKPKLFRPPYGVTNPNLARAVKEMKYTPMGWSVRSLDTVAKDANILLDKLIRRLEPGAIYLFHDTVALTAEVLPLFLRQAKEMGYEIVRPDLLTETEPYA